jgi:ABC-type multidrug transport system ATPase subunit
MIRSLEILEPKNTFLRWLGGVKALSKPRKFEFKPGLNVIWGRNGAGKSTIIQLLANLFHCHQAGVPVVTATSIQDLFSNSEDPTKSIKVCHDGQGVRYFDPSMQVGVVGGGAAFDWDFGPEGVANYLFRGSAGQVTLKRFNKVLESLVRRTTSPEVEYKVTSGKVNSLWESRLQIVGTFLKGSGEVGQPTILLDEPERSLDLNHQPAIWRILRAYAASAVFNRSSIAGVACPLPSRYVR